MAGPLLGAIVSKMTGLFTSTDHQGGGYDCKFVDPEDPPTYMLCLICLSVAKSPQQMDCCGKLVCEECITLNRKESPNCPHCRAVGTSFKDKRAEQQILSLLVKCDHCENDCKWIGELRSLEEHKLKQCGYTRVLCPNKCTKNCAMQRLYLDSHLNHHCPKRSYKCPKCGELGKFDAITTEHLRVCPNVMVRCSNEGCTYTCLRNKLKLHECPYDKVNCMYSNIGCTQKVLRKDIQSHQNDNSHHLRLASKTMAKLNEEVAVLRKEKVSLQQQVANNKIDIGNMYHYVQLHSDLLKKANSQIEKLQCWLGYTVETVDKNNEAVDDMYQQIHEARKHLLEDDDSEDEGNTETNTLLPDSITYQRINRPDACIII